MSEKLKPCPFCGGDKEKIDKIVKVMLIIHKYVDADLFLTNFILGDWEDQPLEVKQLIKRLKIKAWNRRVPTPSNKGE